MIKSFIAQTKPVWWSLNMAAHEIWCRDSDQGTSLGRSIPCPPALCSMKKIHLRPGVLRPTSPRNISLILNQEYSSWASWREHIVGCLMCLALRIFGYKEWETTQVKLNKNRRHQMQVESKTYHLRWSSSPGQN
ncbi:embryonic stem cell-related gene protein-like isoform X2 [Pan troglodytes]|uniref:embryonic stem cell-related gene protein-like isoform X2 n=1 Tax=Pan troglodytes TaxID=9598 RepID=UPI0030134688